MIGYDTVEILGGNNLVIPVKAGVEIHPGMIVAVKDGLASPGVKATGIIAVGRAEEYVDNRNGSDGQLYIKVKRGIFKLENDLETPVEQKDIFKSCYFVDAITVTSLATGSSVTGKILGLEDGQVIVEII